MKHANVINQRYLVGDVTEAEIVTTQKMQCYRENEQFLTKNPTFVFPTSLDDFGSSFNMAVREQNTFQDSKSQYFF